MGIHSSDAPFTILNTKCDQCTLLSTIELANRSIPRRVLSEIFKDRWCVGFRGGRKSYPWINLRMYPAIFDIKSALYRSTICREHQRHDAWNDWWNGDSRGCPFGRPGRNTCQPFGQSRHSLGFNSKQWPSQLVSWQKMVNLICNLMETLSLIRFWLQIVLTIGISSAAIYSVFVSISLETGLSLGDLTAGTGYMFLFFGLRCLVFQPFELTYGGRGILLLSLLGTVCMNVRSTHARTNGTWIATRLIGYFGSPSEFQVKWSLPMWYVYPLNLR
jgi:hypothetical protein